MRQAVEQLVQDFLDAIGRGEPLDALITDDLEAWTVSSGETDKARFLGGCALLAGIFGGSLRYEVNALTVEDDRAAAEVTSRGTLPGGEAFRNDHVFVFRVRDGRVARVAEFMNQVIVNEKIVPLMQAAMDKARG